ncbi:PREDICTED: cytoplasmic dynein 2 heavy chain 1 [Polistes canadensis]|uniref:cytoplasmic dynein 2 heavy chain 1 n=1 Tax=Polistes canadensis TaxID=91411 RepID=UPI000718FBDF|nr:PREDICTED: cytoplasmic dynein 2 heavy chain 1 [Polistes canadensis]
MVMIDKRGSFIVSTAGYFFGVPLGNEENSKLSLPVLDKFFNQSTCRTLCAQPIQSENDEITLKLSNELLVGKNTLVFFKLAAKIVTEENFHDLVQVTSIGGGESLTLIEVLRQVWAPTLKSFGFDPTSLKKLEEDLLGPRPPTSITEEESFWIKRSNEASRTRDKTTFDEAAIILNNIKKEFENAAVSRGDGFIGLEESLEAISGYVDDVWKLGSTVYKEERMKSLLEIIGNETVILVENLVNETHHGHSNVDTTVSMGAMVCDKWVNASERLTGLFWPHYSLHPWKDAVYVPGKCSKLGRRLKQLGELRAQYRQLMRLLTSNERMRLDVDNYLENFQDIKVVYSDDENDIEWNRMIRKVEEALMPTEELVAQKLKAQIADAKTSNSLLEEFRRYFDLMKRDALKKALRSEREALLLAYDDLIENCLAGPDTDDLLDTPKILQEIQTARYSEIRLESLLELGKELLADIPGFDDTVVKVTTALKDAERKRQYLVESWVNDTKDAVAKKQLTLGSDSAVVELTGTSLMRVNYDPRLMTLIREARALSGQGVVLPREIRDLVERASLLAGRARALQQVATFHNTIGDRMVPSQRPLMLTTALELARAVKEQSGVVWSDPQAVDGYTNRLRELVTKFARQNAELAAKHSNLRNLVSNLFKGEAINLVGNQNIWKDTLINMRTIVDSVENEYGNTTAWKLHWDRQLLKALGVAYRGALPSLLRKLPDIRVELIFRDGMLQWRPTLEEIRAKIYSGIRRSLSIPMNFRGVGDVEHAQFGSLVQKSAYLFGGVYKQAEIALNALESVRIKWLNLAAPAKIDIGEKLKGASPNDWTRAFKDAKQWAQEVGKLRGGDVKVWCISIDTGTTRNDLESASRRYWERLCSDLRVEAFSRLVAIVDFLSFAAKELEKRPHNVEEVGLANEAHERIEKQYDGVGNEMEAVAGLAKVLAAWTSEKLEGINSANLAWQELAERLEKHKTVVAHQLEDTKVNLRHRGIALRDEIERWETKWLSKPDIVTIDWISSMRDRWITLTEQRDSLTIDCQRIAFNLSEIIEDDSTNLKKLEAQLEAEESNCRFQAEFIEELDNQRAEEWAVARRRLPRLHDWLDSWETRIRLQSNDKDSSNPLNDNNIKIETFVGKQLREIRDAIEWIQLLRGDEIAEEHWNELKSVLDLNDIKNLRDLTLGNILDSKNKIKDNVIRIKEITKRAAAESGIRQAILELESWETSASLQIQQSKDSQHSIIYLVGEYSNLLARTGELRLLLEGAKGAAGYERFAARATRCEASLSEIEERIKILSIVQRKWVYLEPIYGSGAAPNDSGKWSRTDKEFRYLMGEVSRDSRVSSIRRLPLPALINLKDLLDRCQRSLDEFLEERRSSYPRLYFLSDEDLLELVSGSGKALESHLPKLYQGIGSVIKNDNSLTAVVSPEGEILKLLEAIDTSEPLPRWLNNLEKGMRNTLRQSLDKCLTDSSPDPSIYPNQILLLSERIRFTERCEAALKEGVLGLKKLVEFLDTQRARYRGLEDVGDKLTVLKARGLLLDTVHHLEISRTLLNNLEMGESTSWLWYRQLKTYRTNKGPIIRCAAAEFPYRFEYQGAAVGLVWTSLTEKCFLALTQAMKLGLGGSPTGPAGTGKTESVKALGGILGRLVIVFNCDEGMDAGSMKRILGGLAQAGAWGCFDEFNRLEEETLSAVAMLVRPLQEAVRDGLNQVVLGDQRVNLDPHCCVFITMNPAGNEYGGRHRLPDSLARLFRPIGMAHPDKFDIIRALLECAGFLESSMLANRLVETFEISFNLLSKQPHYDWGLRALRSVLDAISPVNQLDESTRLFIAIKDSTLPKLTEEDAKKFLDLLDDVFPNVDHSLTEVSNEKKDLREALIELCESGNYTKKIIDQCIQLYDQLKSRTGVAIVGPPGSGKTVIRKLLTEALSKIGESVDQYIIYPGAVPKSKLLGRVDSQTREWKEGLLSSAVITAGGDNSTWIILNGDVEPEWAEALNSALDDNRLLTLPNGVGVKLGNGIRFIFETHKLASASPATVSRLGVVHLGTISPTSLLQALIPDDLPANIRDNVTTHVSTCINEIFQSNSIRSSACGLINSVFHHLRDAHTQTLYTEGLLGALCCQIEDQNVRDNLGRLIYQLTDCWCPDPEKPLDVLYNDKSDRLEPFIDIYQSIETEDGPILLSGPVKRALASILPWIENSYPVILRGEQGSGKSTLITAALSSLKNQYNAPSMTLIQGSSLYGAQDLLTRLKRACVRLDSSSHGRTYKPRNGSRIILILEDIHLASKQMQELVRELLQDEGFHEDDLEFARIPLTIISTADSNTPLHPRLECLMATYYLPCPSSKEIVAMLELHLRSALKEKDDFIDSWITKTSPIMFEAYQSINLSNELSSFLWTPKDLILWADCLGYYLSPENENDLTSYMFDAGKRLFYPKLTAEARVNWDSILSAQFVNPKNSINDVFVWKIGNTELLPIVEEEWKDNIVNVAARCAREGEPIHATITSHLLQMVAGICWTFGTRLRGVILTGRPGSGRKSASKLAATFSSFRYIDSGPGRAKASIKSAIQTAGIDGEPTMLLLEEHHMREEDTSILVSAIIANGELPGLFSIEELDGMIAPLIDLSRREDFPGTLEQYFYHRIRNYLRVVVILDIGDLKSTFLSRSGLLRICAVIGPSLGNEWWSYEAPLTELAIQYNNSHGSDVIVESSKGGIEVMIKAHLQAPKQQQAPARFLALLCTTEKLREIWSEEVESKLNSLTAGISRLREAGEHVAKLEDEVSKQRQELEIEKGRANAALEKITATMRGATGQRGEMTNLKAETERESAELARRKADIEGELSKVEPLVEQAAQAVAGISADALAEVRSLRAPPAPVRDVLEGVLRLMGIKDTSWNSMKTFLAKRGIKDEIRTWDARRSTSASLDAVAKLVKERPDSFEEKTARRASIAAAPLAAWVLANLQYGQILQQVAPLEREQRLLAERLSAAEAQLGRLAAGLNTVESRVAQLQEELAEHSRGAASLQLRTESTESSLITARSLLLKLDKEHRDWQTQLEELTNRKERLDVEAANVASFLVYQDPQRDDKWKRSAIELLIDERERLIWRAQGLPADTGSLVGAACALRGPLVPIFLDPSGVAVSWLKSNIGSKLEITKAEDTKFYTALELAVRFGKPLLVEEIIEFPSILLKLLRKRPLRLCDRDLPAQQGFQLFLATRKDRLDNIPKEADAVLFQIALGAGTRSLAERLVDKVLLKETPEIISRRREALEREEKLSGERDAARVDLLAQLGRARGQDLLQETQGGQGNDSNGSGGNGGGGGGLLTSLEKTQTKAKEILLALEESRRSLEDISKRIESRERLAKFAANVYKAVKGLTSLNPLYVFSTEAFTDIYLEAESTRSIAISDERKEQDRLVEKRLIALTVHYCTKAAYRKHRLTLALYLALSLNPISEIDRNLLLDSGLPNNGDNVDLEVPDWIPDERRTAVKVLASFMPQVAGKMKRDWLNDIGNVYTDNNLTHIQRILIIKALRPDYLHTALSKFAISQLGVRDLAPPTWTLQKIAENDGSSPILLLLSPGADPGPELKSLVGNLVASSTGFTEVSLGQGQVTQAELALETACKNGSWVLLSNLQLALTWLPRLESLLRSPMCTANKNSTTRIWLTTEECEGFYPGLAGLCLKLAYEPPEGVQRNFKRSFQQLQQLDDKKTNVNIPGMFLLSWLHSTIQERRKFVPQAWIRSYEWNEADLGAAYTLIVDKTIKSNQTQNWETGQGLLDVAVYGGRLQDDYDMRALCAIIREIWSKDVFEGRRTLAGVLNILDISENDPMKIVERLDSEDSPREYFGLPANAHRAWERVAAEIALTLLKGMTIKISSNEKTRGRTRSDNTIEKDLKELLDRRLTKIEASLNPLSNDIKKETPLKRFFADELEFTRDLLNRIRLDLELIRIEDTKTPNKWMNEWQSGPKDAVTFVHGLLTRYQILESFEMSFPLRVDLSKLARPRAFLAALKQHTAREINHPLENLRLRVNWMLDDNRSEQWKVSVIIEGLLISGALIKDSTLKDVDVNAAPIAAAPICQIAYLPERYSFDKDSDKKTLHSYYEKKEDKDWISIPVYNDSQRSSFVCSFPIGCPRENRNIWLRRSVALYFKPI